MNPILAAGPAALIGFALGWLSAFLTERMQPPEDTKAIRGRSRLVRDPFVQGGLALVWAAVPVVQSAASPTSWLEAGLLAVALVQVHVTDFPPRHVCRIVAA